MDARQHVKRGVSPQEERRESRSAAQGNRLREKYHPEKTYSALRGAIFLLLFPHSVFSLQKVKGGIMRYLCVVLLLGILTGCSTLPDADKITSFGSAVEQSGQSLETIASENIRIALLSDQEKEAVKYIKGESKYDVLSKPVYRIAEREFAFRRTQLKALANYGAALKQASDPKKLQEIEDASSKLATAVGGFVGMITPAATVAAPIINAAGKGASMAITNRYARRINAVIAETDPYVQTAVKNLKSDFATINKNSQRRLDAYQKNTWDALSEMRSKEVETQSADGQVKTELQARDPDHLAPLYSEFTAANQRIIEATVAVEAAEKAEATLDKIAAAHSALKEDTATSAPSIDDLLSFSDNLTALVSAAKGK